MKKHEAGLTTRFLKRMKELTRAELRDLYGESGVVFEFKQKSGGVRARLKWSDFEDHQLITACRMSAVEGDPVFYKISDLAGGRKPCDAFGLWNVRGVVGCVWRRLRGGDEMFLFDVADEAVFKALREGGAGIAGGEAERYAFASVKL